MRRAFLLAFFIGGMALSLYAQEKPDALALYRERRYSEAVAVCLQEIQETPRRVDSYVVLGWSLLALDRYQEALDYSERALAFAPYDYRLLMNAGESAYFLGAYDKALSYFQQYVAVAPTGRHIPEVYAYMGEIYLRWGEFYHADIAFSTAVYHRKDVPTWWIRLGYAREQSRQLRLALAAYEEAVKLAPSNQEATAGVERVREVLARSTP
ncbi:tetratricopeptide repeat protein [Spirochaeta thermophila]|uniref:TPR domain protein n=1 Tax=Winmispira thermophila (strain ATCC 49972 / DSM 6192 / RI 19.B1) TaxID=665571 RepID=E0RS34_WINT6|nr:tetratricopeptide repeat protein [Spirochaeta thermophila]ADN01821.1 TPR domain protein [Spirochaeta thermophila DSM 6192]